MLGIAIMVKRKLRSRASNRRKERALTKRKGDGIGQMIRHHRLRLRLTQEQLVARGQLRGLDMSRGTLAKIELGLQVVKARELFLLAQALGFSVDKLKPLDMGQAPS